MSSTRYSCYILMKLEFCRQIFKKYSNIKFRENPSIGSRVGPCGRTDGRTDRRRGTTKLIVASRSSARSALKQAAVTAVQDNNDTS